MPAICGSNSVGVVYIEAMISANSWLFGYGAPRRGKAASGIFPLGGAAIAFGLLLAACGSSAGSSPTTTGAAPGTAPTTGPTAQTSGGGLDFAKLGSLTNYVGTMTDNGVSFKYVVHSPTNWEELLGKVAEVHVGGYVYTQIGSFWSKIPDGPNVYKDSAYPGAVAQFTDFRKVAGSTLTKGAACSVAGISGHYWTLASPHTATLSESETICLADSSGALLSFGSGASGSAVPANGFAYTFTISQVGGVAAFSAPAAAQAG